MQNDTIIKRTLLISVLCICLCAMLTACGNSKSEIYYLDDFVEDGYLLEGSYLSVKDGGVEPMEQEDFQETIESTSASDLSEKAETYRVNGVSVQILSAVMSYDSSPRRVSAIFDNTDQTVAQIGITSVYTLAANFKDYNGDELSLKQQKAIIKKVAKECQLSSSGVSAITRESQLRVPGEHQYAAVAFYPYVCTVQVSIKTDAESENLEIVYPVLNQNGYLDGVYAVVEGDTIEILD